MFPGLDLNYSMQILHNLSQRSGEELDCLGHNLFEVCNVVHYR